VTCGRQNLAGVKHSWIGLEEGFIINNNKHCIGVFLDIKKAFDCVQ